MNLHVCIVPYVRTHCGATHQTNVQAGAALKLGIRKMSEQEFLTLRSPGIDWSHLCHHASCATFHHATGITTIGNCNKIRTDECYRWMLQGILAGLLVPPNCNRHIPPCKLHHASISWADAYRRFEALITIKLFCTFDDCVRGFPRVLHSRRSSVGTNSPRYILSHYGSMSAHRILHLSLAGLCNTPTRVMSMASTLRNPIRSFLRT